MSLYKFKEKLAKEYLFDVTSTLKVRELSFLDIERIIEEKLEDSSKYIENYLKKKYDSLIESKDEDQERGNIINYEEWVKSLNCRDNDLGLFLTSSSFYDICKTYFYSDKSKSAFVHSNLLYKFYFDQFGYSHKQKTFDHNIILLNLLSLTRDSSMEKVKIFYKIVNKLAKPTVRNVLDILRDYLEKNLFGVMKKLIEVSQENSIKYEIEVFLVENETILDNVISDIINEILLLYDLKDVNEEKIYSVDESDCDIIFKDKHLIFNFEELWKYCLERADRKKRNY